MVMSWKRCLAQDTLQQKNHNSQHAHRAGETVIGQQGLKPKGSTVDPRRRAAPSEFDNERPPRGMPRRHGLAALSPCSTDPQTSLEQLEAGMRTGDLARLGVMTRK